MKCDNCGEDGELHGMLGCIKNLKAKLAAQDDCGARKDEAADWCAKCIRCLRDEKRSADGIAVVAVKEKNDAIKRLSGAEEREQKIFAEFTNCKCDNSKFNTVDCFHYRKAKAIHEGAPYATGDGGKVWWTLDEYVADNPLR